MTISGSFTLLRDTGASEVIKGCLVVVRDHITFDNEIQGYIDIQDSSGVVIFTLPVLIRKPISSSDIDEELLIEAARSVCLDMQLE